MTCEEAGRRGGEATLRRHGVEHFRRLAAKANGRRGAIAQRVSLGPDGMEQKARAGGEALLAQRGKEHYARLGRLSAATRAANRARGAAC